MGNIANERQAREAAKVPEDKRADVIKAASEKAESENRPMTARYQNGREERG